MKHHTLGDLSPAQLACKSDAQCERLHATVERLKAENARLRGISELHDEICLVRAENKLLRELAECDKASTAADIDNIRRLIAERDDARARLADAELDSRRLDWLEQNANNSALATQKDGTVTVFTVAQDFDGLTLRAAIDAALDARGGKE